MKVQKGTAGYISAKKRQLVMIIGVTVVIILGLLIAGYFIYDSRMNWLTIVAILVCLPICRTIVNLIMLIPYTSISEKTEMEISGKTEDLITLFDLIITSEKKAMKIDAAVISRNVVCGYVKSPKYDTDYAAKHIKSILEQNGIEKVTVKIFKDYVAFLSRAEGMQSIASVEKNEAGRREQEIEQLILSISL